MSRKAHGSTEFDIPLPLDPALAGVECRTGGPTKVILTFNEGIKAADGTPDATEVSLSAGTAGTVSIAGAEMTINMTGVPDASCLDISLSGISDLAGNALAGNSTLRVLVLAGDANANKAVNAQDMLAVKAHIDQPVDNSNARYDVNCNGMINAQDLLAVKSRIGSSAPECPAVAQPVGQGPNTPLQGTNAPEAAGESPSPATSATPPPQTAQSPNDALSQPTVQSTTDGTEASNARSAPLAQTGKESENSPQQQAPAPVAAQPVMAPACGAGVVETVLSVMAGLTVIQLGHRRRRV